MHYSPLLIVHIAAGLIAVLSGSISLFVRKGGRLHRASGNVFVIAMLLMASGGGYIALIKGQRTNVLAGLFTFYLVASAWLTMRRKANETGRRERVLLLMALATGTLAIIFSWQAAHNSTGKGSFAVGYAIFATIALLSAAGDVRMLIRGGVSGPKRLVRHLWRMGFALFIATGSFFLGTAGDPVMKRVGLRARLFTPEIRHTHLPQVPVLIVVALTIFWLFRVWFSSAYKTPKTPRPEHV
jgi:uncharacterized membrane protein